MPISRTEQQSRLPPELIFDLEATTNLRYKEDKEVLSRHHDVIIVGAGPGGATAAGILARAGFKVLLLDREPPGRDKTCGDAVSGRGVELLHKTLGLEIDASSPPPLAIEGVTIVAPNEKKIRLKLDPEREYPDITWPRAGLDKAILDQAMNLQENGESPNHGGSIDFVQMNVRKLLRDPKTGEAVGVVGTYKQGDKRELVECYGDYIIGADGASSVVAREIGFDPGEKAIATRTYGKVTDPEKLQGGLMTDLDIALIYRGKIIAPAYEWIFYITKDEVNVGLGVFNQMVLETLKQEYDIEDQSVIEYLLKDFYKRLKDDYGIEVDEDTERVWSIPVWLQRREVMFEGGWVMLIGDAAADTDPLTAGGIGPAIEGAYIVAEVIKAMRKEGLSVAEARKKLNELREQHIHQKMRKRLLIQQLIASHPGRFNLLFMIAAHSEKIKKWLAQALAADHVSV